MSSPLAGVTPRDLTQVRSGLDRVLRASVGYDIASIATVDPATMLWTSCYSSGLPPGGEAERKHILYDIEFNGGDINGYRELRSSGALVGRLHQATGGDVTRATRWQALLGQLGIIDELRAVLVSRDMAWATLTLYRLPPARAVQRPRRDRRAVGPGPSTRHAPRRTRRAGHRARRRRAELARRH